MACIVENAFFVFLLSLSCVVHAEELTRTFQTKALHPALDFSRHTLVKPKIFHGREKRQISTTKEQNGAHSDHIFINLEVDGQDLTLDLTLNKQLIPKGFFHRYQENGKPKVHKPDAQDIELCHYNGKVRGKPDSWVAISTCNGLSGVIFDGNEMHYIENERHLENNFESDHFLYKHENILELNKTCGYDGDAHDIHKDNRILRYKRNAEPNELVRGPYNANKESKYVELVLVIDNREYKELGENIHKVTEYCKSIANIINALYSPLNIFIALVGVVIWTEHDEISFSKNGDMTLTNFLHYRREKLIKEHPNDNAQLLSKFTFDNGVVGKALKGPMCTYEYSGGVNTDHSPVVGLVATTIAHEMGHNFGMEHDTNECKCPDNRCIMAPSSSSEAPTHWSSCSLNYLLLAFTHGMDYCLKNKPEALFDSPVCGNGFVEPGEQCDCGLSDHCDNYCCNAMTCMLHSNASCATGECCDLNTCRPKNAGSVCRSADYECDLPEYCTGQSEYCPSDVFKMDTESCDNGNAYCYHGFCRTRTDQCKLLWGETGKSSDEQCYTMNTKGSRHGNCGYNQINKSYTKCVDENILCGMLHCKHLNERLEFGMESVAILSQTFINSKGTIIPCRNAIVDLGINQVDPGLAPDGASCGDGKMCVNQKCMPVASLRRESATCPNNCNGNGWCNSLGHCHCKNTFAPPFCDSPGHGGSEDSGPAVDPNANLPYVRFLFIVFLGIIPGIALFTLLFYYARRNNPFHFSKKSTTPAMSKSPTKPRNGGTFLDSSKRNEDNHSLLHDEATNPGLQNEFFGHFKGFTLTPIKGESDETLEPEKTPPKVPVPTTNKTPKNKVQAIVNKVENQVTEPVRAAPAPPTVPNVVIKSPLLKTSAKTSFLSKAPSFKKNALVNALNNINTTSSAPALPPPNPGSSARPIISAPVLENSTCTAKELVSPLRNIQNVQKPLRHAPEVPKTHERPLSTPTILETIVVEIEEVKKPSNTKLNRITSFLKPNDKKTATLPRSHQVKANKIDKTQLKTIEISNPIPQTHIDLAITALPVETPDQKAVVMRAQSMRQVITKRPNIQTFGSMRQPNAKRPISTPSGGGQRPKSPPPPRPPESLPHESKNDYDDCLNKQAPLARLSEVMTPTSGDNIYAVIEETPTPVLSPEKTHKSASGSNESMGLLGEIVDEIQNRNLDSIYSTSTLARKKKEKEAELDQLYENTSYTDSVYSNMNGSTTSSGYIHPSAINAPVKSPKASETERKYSNTGQNANTPTLTSATPTLRSATPTSTMVTPTLRSTTPTLRSGTPPLSQTTPSSQATPPKRVTTPSPTRIPSPQRKTPPQGRKITPPITQKRTTSPLPPKTANKPPPTKINRQITPPNLKIRKASPTRPPATPAGGSTSNRSSNSPDLVTSHNSTKVNKQPDVLLINTKKPATSVKPNINGLPKGPPKVVAKVVPPVALAKPESKIESGGSKNIPPGVKIASKQNSTVASLQQKFENK